MLEPVEGGLIRVKVWAVRGRVEEPALMCVCVCVCVCVVQTLRYTVQ